MNEQMKYSKNDTLEHELQAILTQQSPLILTQKEKEFITKIKTETEAANKDNVTRTKAYLHFYLIHPEIHWAFLAHMVSRNGGYNMTDLQSSLIKPLLTTSKQVHLFQFLEKANAFIFHDAYPQLLIYKKSVEDNTPYFHLLPTFNVSKFMIPIWDYFFQNRAESILLTHALITNEQQYVEKHLISLDDTKQSVFHTFTYLLQETLGFTHVVFPYKRYPFLRKYSLFGLEIHNFYSVQHRIDIGKRLYKMLFSKRGYSSVFNFATTQKHSASRSDYWPHVFSTVQDNTKLFSPSLEQVWESVHHTYPSYKDWFTSFSQVQQVKTDIKTEFKDITKDIIHDLNVMKSLVNMKKVIKS